MSTPTTLDRNEQNSLTCDGNDECSWARGRFETYHAFKNDPVNSVDPLGLDSYPVNGAGIDFIQPGGRIASAQTLNVTAKNADLVLLDSHALNPSWAMELAKNTAHPPAPTPTKIESPGWRAFTQFFDLRDYDDDGNSLYGKSLLGQVSWLITLGHDPHNTTLMTQEEIHAKSGSQVGSPYNPGYFEAMGPVSGQILKDASYGYAAAKSGATGFVGPPTASSGYMYEAPTIYDVTFDMEWSAATTPRSAPLELFAGPRLPRSGPPTAANGGGVWSGERGNSLWFSSHPDILEITEGAGIPFVDYRPNLDLWSERTFDVEGLMGYHSADKTLILKSLAQQLNMTQQGVTNWLTDQQLRAHHAGGTKVQLIPAGLHDNLPHTGGAADLRNGN